MTTETMNVHQALAELKMMDKRIEAATREPEWVVTNKHSNTKINGVAQNLALDADSIPVRGAVNG